MTKPKQWTSREITNNSKLLEKEGVNFVEFSDHETDKAKAVLDALDIQYKLDKEWKLSAKMKLRLMLVNKGVGDHDNKDIVDEVFEK